MIELYELSEIHMLLNVELLESSFNLVAPRADELVSYFYDRLFREHPEVRPLFPEAMDEQKKHLIAALAAVIQNLRNPEQLTSILGDLAIRHIDYGVQREHYSIVGQTLLASLAEIIGEGWSDELQTAWSDAYGAIQSIIFKALDNKEAA